MATVKSGRRKVKAQRFARRKARRLLKEWRKKKKGVQAPFWIPLTRPAIIDRALAISPPAIVGNQLAVVVPPKLNFGDDIRSTLHFFTELRSVLLGKQPSKVVNIDHRGLVDVQPDAALVLIAALYQADFHNPGCRKVCHFPTDPGVRELLWDVGYFKYFPRIKNPPSQQQTVTRYFLRHQHGSRTKGTAVKDLILHFERIVQFGPGGRSNLYKALVECMNNVAEHAYPLRKRFPHTYKEWWLLGYFDTAAREICFCFFDQGVGIPKTIRTRIRDYVRSGSTLIAKAVEEGRSSTKLTTRGKGLPSLKRFVEASAAGQLSIVSSRSQCIFPKAGVLTTADYSLALYGTLITWNIKPGGFHEGDND